jgi:hypothetical protein
MEADFVPIDTNLFFCYISLYLLTGVVERLSNAKPEITPVEPDPDNAGGGICS